MALSFKSLLPRGLFGRAALILLVPVVAIQLVVSAAFIRRHYEGVTRQLTQGVTGEIALIAGRIGDEGGPVLSPDTARLAEALGMTVSFPAADAPRGMPDLAFWDLSGREVIAMLEEGLPALSGVAFAEAPRTVRVAVDTPRGVVEVTVPRRRLSASNPHQLLVLMLLASVLLTLVAYHFLRLQLRPITRLAEAADAFGKGRNLPYRPRGAIEVRAAGLAFLDMRARIERQIESRTLMLSGISHDLRTPLTRMRLGLSLLPQDEEVRALLQDVAQMERMVDGFLAFARGDATEDAVAADPAALARGVVEDAVRMGQPVRLATVEGGGDALMRPAAVRRALENLIGNAVRHGTRAEVSVAVAERSVRFAVDDDGPGIPKERREEALAPFARLDGARDPNRGGGVGLGLTIAADIARSHGGTLRLGDSPTLGGLRAELVLAR